MAKPSSAHERRVQTLEAVARLSGYSAPAVFPGLAPDVLLACGADLFVGEAKATETPGCSATRERLSRYVRHLHRRHENDVLVLCVAAEAVTWASMIERLTRNVTGGAWPTVLTNVSEDEWLVAARPTRPKAGPGTQPRERYKPVAMTARM